MQRKINKGFTILEILVVLFIIGIIIIFGFPNVSKWITDREVRKEVNSLIYYLEEKKSEVDAGKYAISLVRVGNNNGGAWWTMSNQEWNRQMKVPAPAVTAQNNLPRYNNKSILNHSRSCPGAYEGYNSAGTQYWSKQSTAFNSSKIIFTPAVHMCISKDAIIHPFGSGETFRGIPGKSWVMICSTKNTTQNGSKRCHYNMSYKADYRYVVQITRGLDFVLYKYNLGQDKWVKQ